MHAPLSVPVSTSRRRSPRCSPPSEDGGRRGQSVSAIKSGFQGQTATATITSDSTPTPCAPTALNGCAFAARVVAVNRSALGGDPLPNEACVDSWPCGAVTFCSLSRLVFMTMLVPTCPHCGNAAGLYLAPRELRTEQTPIRCFCCHHDAAAAEWSRPLVRPERRSGLSERRKFSRTDRRPNNVSSR